MFRITYAWTGGQYSVFRALLGAYLFVHFATLIPWGAEMFSNVGVLPDAAMSPLRLAFPNILSFVDAPAMVSALLVLASVASIAFALGYRDKVAAIVCWYVWGCLFGRNPLIANPSIPYVGWLLLAHLFMPGAPYGSFAARKGDSLGDYWGRKYPTPLWSIAWFVMAVSYTYSGWTKLASPSWVDGTAFRYLLENPLARDWFVRDVFLAMPEQFHIVATYGALGLEFLFLPLAFVPKLRKWIWLAMVLMHCGLLSIVSFADLSTGMLLMHFFTFDTAWIPQKHAGIDTVFYDGNCGLCHGAVKFILAEDSNAVFRFAPLFGETHKAVFTTKESETTPESIVVRTNDGRTFVKSDAVLYIAAALGGMWRAFAFLGRCVPRVLRDVLYDAVAKIRTKLAAPPKDFCPILPSRLRQRFND